MIMSIVAQDLLLQVENLHKRFDDHVVLAGVGVEVARGKRFHASWSERRGQVRVSEVPGRCHPTRRRTDNL